MRKQHSLIADAVAACLARADGVLPAEVLEHLLLTSRAELEPYYEANFRKGLLSDIRQALKGTTLDDGVETGEPTQLPLPGYRAPTTVPVRQEGGEYRYIRFEKLTGKDFLQAIETRKDGILRDQERLKDLQEKWRVLRRYLLKNDTMTVGEAVQLFTQQHHSVSS